MKKIYVFTLLVLLSATLMYFGKLHIDVIEPTTTIDPELIPVKKALLELQQEKDFQQLNKEEQLDRTLAVLDTVPDSHLRLRHQYQIALGKLPDIVFYGRVIDQYGQPVEGASIWHSGENAYLSAGGGKGFAKTDKAGYFMLDTSGAALVLGSIKHSEIDSVVHYRISKQSFPKIQYSTTVRFLSHDKNNVALNYNNYNKKSKAYVIQVWRLGEYEGAFGGYSSFHIASDSTVNSLVFDNNKNTINLTDDKAKAQFHISCTRPHMENNQDYGDWSLNITPVNGGIVETNDPYLNLAPESGYQASAEVRMQKGEKDYRHLLKNQRYYFSINNHNNYGSLNAHYEPFYGPEKEACIVRINYKLNPNGSRNLELKRNKENIDTHKLGAENRSFPS